MRRTLLQPSTSIWVSSADHFFRAFFSALGEAAGPSSLPSPLLAVVAAPDKGELVLVVEDAAPDAAALLPFLVFEGVASNPVSSLKSHPSTTRGAWGNASDTRLCFNAGFNGDDEDAGDCGTLNAKGGARCCC